MPFTCPPPFNISDDVLEIHEELWKIAGGAEVRVITLAFPREIAVHRVMKVVVPLGVQAQAANRRGPEQPNVVQVTLRDHVHEG